MRNRGFTLIELLIVVAIIAILAAIAVPNFLEAQTRAKVSRARADMRSIATAIEAYRVDNNQYPLATVDAPFGNAFVATAFQQTFIAQLTTPIAYMTSVPFDSFMGDMLVDMLTGDTRRYFDYRRTFFPASAGYFTIDEIATGSMYNINASQAPQSWLLWSVGPDRQQDINTVVGGGFGDRMGQWRYYDATNGTISSGDIIRSPEGDDKTLAAR